MQIQRLKSKLEDLKTIIKKAKSNEEIKLKLKG